MLPFLALGFATAYRAWSWETIALAVPSGVFMLGGTATDPVRAVTWNWVERVWDGTFAGSGVWPKLPLAVCVVAAVVLCARATPIGRPTPAQAAGAALTLALYIAIALAGPRLVGTRPILLVFLVVLSITAVATWHYRPWLPRRAPERSR
jgi:hypothetical protein